ncbi:MAG: ribosomal protein S18-alanine N-acetyltransferase [Actinomycetota bacterium]|nr:ribosomal protein S18-alanine N-acetyltransferase [Actinomycetota bacterium]
MAVHFPHLRGEPTVPRPRPEAVIEIVPMRRRHVRAVVAIEQGIFPRPWSTGLYLSELAQPETRAYFVALAEGGVVGYIGSMIVAGEGHITTVGVAPVWQHRGVATRLLHRVATEARARGAEALTLEVRMSNVGAQSLYRAFGFAPAGVRKNYYAEVNEDGLVMWAHDVQSEAYRERIDALLARALRPLGGASDG